MPFFKNLLVIALATVVLSACNHRVIKGPEPTVAKAAPFLEENDRQLSFPPRFGEHNQEIYEQILGYSKEDLLRFKEKKMIFPVQIIEANGKRMVCKQCSSCHSCR